MQFYNDYWRLYENILYANTVLSNIDKVAAHNEPERLEIKGMALFLRSYAFLQVANLYASQYSAGTGGDGPGIILRLNAEMTEPSYRATLQETYDQIESDLRTALPLLPKNAPFKNRPVKAAGYALLARFYLQTKQYEKAKESASAGLALRPELLDYNTVNAGDPFPFNNFAANPEILYFQTVMDNLMITYDDVPRVDTALMTMYDSSDLRYSLFFKSLTDNTATFRNSYTGIFRPFTGLATDEVYLIRGECYAREGKLAEAMADVNTLRRARFPIGAFVPVTASSVDEALQIVLRERQLELVLRGIRWADLKRLNTEQATAKTLIRKVGASIFTLPPNDKRYALLLPQEVISRSNVEQTPR